MVIETQVEVREIDVRLIPYRDALALDLSDEVSLVMGEAELVELIEAASDGLRMLREHKNSTAVGAAAR